MKGFSILEIGGNNQQIKRDRPIVVDVAKLSGFSIGTVSQALNNKEGVSNQTILKVKEAAEKLGYHPSLAARELRNKRLKIEGLKHFISRTDIPSAIFCADDHIAMGSVKGCNYLNISAPHDISIVGFDDSSICLALEPPLTSVHMPLLNLGKESANILVSERTNGNPDIIKMHRKIRSELIIRNSVISLLKRSATGNPSQITGQVGLRA